MTYNVFSGTLNPTHFTSPPSFVDPSLASVCQCRCRSTTMAGICWRRSVLGGSRHLSRRTQRHSRTVCQSLLSGAHLASCQSPRHGRPSRAPRTGTVELPPAHDEDGTWSWEMTRSHRSQTRSVCHTQPDQQPVLLHETSSEARTLL